MTLHTATIAAFASERRLAMPACPHCGDLLFAPATSAFAGRGKVHHVWACESCGYAFQTAVRFGARRVRRSAAEGNLANA